jgi:hypothetical protein
MANDKSSGASNSVFIDIQKALKGIDYPADRQTMVDTAREQGASDDVMSARKKAEGVPAPLGRTVAAASGGHVEVAQ